MKITRCVRSNRAGLSLVEMLISLIVMMVLLGVLGIVTLNSRGAYEQNSLNSDVDALARRTLEHLVDEFLSADRSTIDLIPAAPFPASGATYQRGQGWDGDDMIPSATRFLRLDYMPGEIDDGLDNNGNGLVDECRVLFTPDADGAPGTSVTRANWIRELLEGELPNGVDDNGNGVADEGGLYLTYDEDTGLVTAELTVERRNRDGRLVTRTARTTVRARNGD